MLNSSALNTCYSCAAPLSEQLTSCEYCGTLKGAQPDDEVLIPVTPPYAFIIAIGVGLLIPLIVPFLIAVLTAQLDGWPSAVLSLVMLVLIPVGYYSAGYMFGRRWPDTSPWAWGVSVVAPLALWLFIHQMIPGLLFILPPYFGAKRGRKWWAVPANKTRVQSERNKEDWKP